MNLTQSSLTGIFGQYDVWPLINKLIASNNSGQLIFDVYNELPTNDNHIIYDGKQSLNTTKIYQDLVDGNVVVITKLNPYSDEANHLIQYIIEQQQSVAKAPHITIYAQHGEFLFKQNAWFQVVNNRKNLNLSLVYTEVPIFNVNDDVLAMTNNVFVSHCNNRTDTQHLISYVADFADFEEAIVENIDKNRFFSFIDDRGFVAEMIVD